MFMQRCRPAPAYKIQQSVLFHVLKIVIVSVEYCLDPIHFEKRNQVVDHLLIDRMLAGTKARLVKRHKDVHHFRVVIAGGQSLLDPLVLRRARTKILLGIDDNEQRNAELERVIELAA